MNILRRSRSNAMPATDPVENSRPKNIRVCFVSNINTFYREPVFEALSQSDDIDIDFFFFSQGGERYWLPEHGVVKGSRQTYLAGFSILGTRVNLSLLWVLFRRQYDVYLKCINGRFALPLTFVAARLRGRPFVLWTEVWMRFRTPAHRLGWPLVRHIYRSADAIVACGTHVRDYLLQEGVAADRIVVARHAVDNALYSLPVQNEEKIKLRDELDVADDAPVVLYLGRFDVVKGLDDLLHAFTAYLQGETYRDTMLVMAGTGPERDRLESMARSLGIDHRVRWPGYIKPADTVRYYAIAEVMVLPSVELPYQKETWGLTVNEAMNQGVPVIATDSVGAAAGRLVVDGVTGLIVPQRDPDALAHALRRVLGDSDFRSNLSMACRTEVAQWTQARMAASFAEAIRQGFETRAKSGQKFL